MLDEEHIKAAKESLVTQRGMTNDLSRWSFLSVENKKADPPKGYVCVAGLKEKNFEDPDKLLLFSFNGESPRDSRANGNAFKGGPVSRRWLEFLLGPETPFPGVVSHIVNKDEIDWINEEGGFIFDETYLDTIGGEMRGFLISSRYCQEFYTRARNWVSMVDDLKIDPLIAWIISMNFTFTEGWVINQAKYPDHAIAYEPYGLYLPNLYKRKFPFGVRLGDGGLGYCMSSLYQPKGPLWDRYYNSYLYPEEEKDEKLWYGVGVGNNVKQAEEKILKALKELENAEG